MSAAEELRRLDEAVRVARAGHETEAFAYIRGEPVHGRYVYRHEVRRAEVVLYLALCNALPEIIAVVEAAEALPQTPTRSLYSDAIYLALQALTAKLEQA